MTAFPPDIAVAPRPWLSRPRSELVAYGVPRVPRIIQVHATRSGVRWDGWPGQSSEFQATCNWVQNDGNKQVSGYGQAWGGCAHAVISEQGRLASFWDKATRYTTYAAGYGEYGWPPGWACDWLAISYELCQPLGDMPFTDACLERAAIEMAKDCIAFGIEPVRIPYLSQQEPMDSVSGFVGHEDTANGHKVGKTDPGPLFPWDEFMADVRRRIAEEDDMPENLFVYGRLKVQRGFDRWMSYYPLNQEEKDDAHRQVFEVDAFRDFVLTEINWRLAMIGKKLADA